MPAELGQNHLIPLLLKIWENSGSEIDLSDTTQETLKKGVCHGLSTVYLCLFALGLGEKWLDTLTKISQSQYTDETDSDTARHIEAIHTLQTNPFDGALPAQIFVEASGISLEFSVCAAALFTKASFEKLLTDARITESPRPLRILNSAHACALRYEDTTAQWVFYDPNCSEGERKYSSLAEVWKDICEMHGSHTETEEGLKKCAFSVTTTPIVGSGPSVYVEAISGQH